MIILRKTTLFMIALFCMVLQLDAQTDSIANLPQFLYPKFSRSVVKLKSGVRQAAMMNYNTVSEKMTFYQNGILLNMNNPETADTIFLHNTKFVFQENRFYEVLVNAPIALFIQHKSDLTSSGKPAPYGASSETAGSTSFSKLYDDIAYNLKLPVDIKVTPSPVYWVRMNNVMNKFSSVRQFIKIFPAKENEIKRFISKFSINIKKQEDLINLVKYCNELYR